MINFFLITQLQLLPEGGCNLLCIYLSLHLLLVMFSSLWAEPFTTFSSHLSLLIFYRCNTNFYHYFKQILFIAHAIYVYQLHWFGVTIGCFAFVGNLHTWLCGIHKCALYIATLNLHRAENRVLKEIRMLQGPETSQGKAGMLNFM